MQVVRTMGMCACRPSGSESALLGGRLASCNCKACCRAQAGFSSAHLYYPCPIYPAPSGLADEVSGSLLRLLHQLSSCLAAAEALARCTPPAVPPLLGAMRWGTGAAGEGLLCPVHWLTKGGVRRFGSEFLMSRGRKAGLRSCPTLPERLSSLPSALLCLCSPNSPGSRNAEACAGAHQPLARQPSGLLPGCGPGHAAAAAAGLAACCGTAAAGAGAAGGARRKADDGAVGGVHMLSCVLSASCKCFRVDLLATPPGP